MKKQLSISIIGTGIQAIGLALDIAHHLHIGIETPEGLLTLNHGLIFIGFLITSFGLFKISRS